MGLRRAGSAAQRAFTCGFSALALHPPLGRCKLSVARDNTTRSVPCQVIGSSVSRYEGLHLESRQHPANERNASHPERMQTSGYFTRSLDLPLSIQEDCDRRGGAAHCLSPMATDASRIHTTHRGSRLGDRLRQLRVAAGMTQSELAARPVLEGVHLADRARQDAPDARDGRLARGAPRRRRRRSSRAASRATSAPAPRRCSRAPRRSIERLDFDGAIDEYAHGARRRSSRAARSSSRCGCSPARPGRGCTTARFAPALDLLAEARGARRRAASSPTSTAPRCSSGSASAAT